MEDFTDLKGAYDLTNRRTLTLANGNKIIFQRTDPYGFWTVHHERGQMPSKLNGHYTSYDRALVAVQAYLQEKGDDIQTLPTLEEKPLKGKVHKANAA